MQFAKLNRDSSEKVYRTIKNVQGATITTGYAVSIKPAAASLDGVSAVIADAAADYLGFIGVANSDIANNDYGLVQVNGLVNSVLVSAAGTSITITAGDCLLPAPAGFYSAAAPTIAGSQSKGVWLVDTATVSAASYVRGLISVF